MLEPSPQPRLWPPSPVVGTHLPCPGAAGRRPPERPRNPLSPAGQVSLWLGGVVYLRTCKRWWPPVFSETCLLRSKRLCSLDSSLEIRQVGMGRAKGGISGTHAHLLAPSSGCTGGVPTRCGCTGLGSRSPASDPSRESFVAQGCRFPSAITGSQAGACQRPPEFQGTPSASSRPGCGSFPGWTPVRTANTMILNVLVVQLHPLRPASGCASLPEPCLISSSLGQPPAAVIPIAQMRALRPREGITP